MTSGACADWRFRLSRTFHADLRSNNALAGGAVPISSSYALLAILFAVLGPTWFETHLVDRVIPTVLGEGFADGCDEVVADTLIGT